MKLYVLLFLFCLLTAVTPAAAQNGVYRTWKSALAQPADVHILKMPNRGMDSLPDVFDQFPNLVKVDFSENGLRSLPPSF